MKSTIIRPRLGRRQVRALVVWRTPITGMMVISDIEVLTTITSPLTAKERDTLLRKAAKHLKEEGYMMSDGGAPCELVHQVVDTFPRAIAERQERNKVDAYVRGVGFKVAHKRCDQCLFSDAKIVGDERRDSLLRECQEDGKYFICHKASLRGDAVVCRGFHESGVNLACRMADRLRLTVYVDPASGAAL